MHDLGLYEEEEEEEDEEVLGDIEGEGDGRLSYRSSPMGPIQRLEDKFAHRRSPVGVVKGEGGDEDSHFEKVVHSEPDHILHLLVGSLSYGIPPTPGRGFRQFDTFKTSQEQQDIQSLEDSEED